MSPAKREGASDDERQCPASSRVIIHAPFRPSYPTFLPRVIGRLYLSQTPVQDGRVEDYDVDHGPSTRLLRHRYRRPTLRQVRPSSPPAIYLCGSFPDVSGSFSSSSMILLPKHAKSLSRLPSHLILNGHDLTLQQLPHTMYGGEGPITHFRAPTLLQEQHRPPFN